MGRIVALGLVPILALIALFIMGATAFNQSPFYLDATDNRLQVAQQQQNTANAEAAAALAAWQADSDPATKEKMRLEAGQKKREAQQAAARVDTLRTTVKTWIFGLDGRWEYVWQLNATALILLLLAAIAGFAFGILLRLAPPAAAANGQAQSHLMLRQFAKKHIDLITGAGLAGLYPVLQIIYHKALTVAANLTPLASTAFAFTLCAIVGSFFIWGCMLAYVEAPSLLNISSE
jgi:hypothetical protein